MNDTIHTTSNPVPASGRFVLRIDPDLHETLRAAARNEGVSLNEYCARKLALPKQSGPVGPGPEAIAKAGALLGDALVGVVAFGSWVRGELAQESDVDILIVIRDEVRIDRALYHEWDTHPLFWNEHQVEPHFVHLPHTGEPFSGTWAEVAVEGVVLFEHDFLVSQTLVKVRQKIVSGEIIRRQLHGQSYWVEAA